MTTRARNTIAACVFVAVVVLGWREPGPSGDGTSYMWMAQQLARGQWHDALSMVFPPGFPLLMALCYGAFQVLGERFLLVRSPRADGVDAAMAAIRNHFNCRTFQR